MSGELVLEVDAGNTRVKWRLISSVGTVGDRGVVPWETLDERQLQSSWRLHDIGLIDLACVASSDKKSRLLRVFKGLVAEDSVVERASIQGLGGVKFAYENMNKLGLDRVLAVIAAHKKYKGGSLVVDSGSAMTADFVSAEGVHLGGYIFPGVSMLRSSLLDGTSNVYARPQMLGNTELGIDTEECVEHAITLMLQSTLKRLAELKSVYEVSSTVLTGGDVDLLGPLMSEEYFSESELVLDGLSFLRAGQS